MTVVGPAAVMVVAARAAVAGLAAVAVAMEETEAAKVELEKAPAAASTVVLAEHTSVSRRCR